MASSTVENYLKAVHTAARSDPDAVVPMGRLASLMGVVPGTATSMVKALAESGLVEYEPRAGVKLTRSGEQLALHVLRRHRIVELFLVQVLGLHWSLVHAEADQLEHAVSDQVLERMDALLGRPTTDPHGDPIPTAKGHLHEPHRMNLTDCEIGVPLKIARVLDQDPSFLQFLDRHGLTPGTTVTVDRREPAAETVQVRLPRRESISLGLVAAAKIQVEPGRK